MTALILQLLKAAWLPIVKWGGLFVVGALALLKARQSGADAVKNKSVENTLKSTQDYENAKDDISKLSDNKLDKLLSQYTRD